MGKNLKNTYYNVITDIIGKLLTLAISILIPKLYIESYGSEYNGLLSSLNGIFVYLNILEAGIGSASIQALYEPIAQKNTSRICEILSATRNYYRRNGVYFVICILILAFSYPLCIQSNIQYSTVVILIILSAIPYIIKFFFQGKYTVLLTADNKLYILNLVNNIVHLIANFIKVVLLIYKWNVIYVQAIFALISLVQIVVIAIYVNRNYKFLNFSGKADVKALTKSKAAMVHEIAYIVFNNTDVVLLTIFCDLKMVSVYSIYNLIFSQLTLLLQSFTNGTSAILGQLFYTNKKIYKKIYINFEFLFQCVACAVIVTAGIMARPFIELYIGDFQDINYSILGLPVLFTSIQILSLLRWPGVGAIKTAGFFKETSNKAIIEVIINLTLSIILVNIIGIQGVLIATIAALMYRTIDILIFVRRKILHDNIAKSLIHSLAIVIFSFVIFTIESQFISTMSSYVVFVFKGSILLVINGVSFILFILLINRKILFDIIEMLNTILFKKH